MDIPNTRLYNQMLFKSRFTNAADTVRWLGAVQAQDYLGALWALGIRTPGATEQEIEKALADRTIVRSWPMRGTLHFVSPSDLRWMLEFLTPRVISRAASIYRKAELDEKVFSSASKIIETALEGGKFMTRDELYAVLEHRKIKTSNSRGLHILGYLAQKGLLCFGPRSGKQQRFTLVEEYLPAAKRLMRDEAFRELAYRYVQSHGPAQIEDLMWWSGLTKKESNEALEANRERLTGELILGKKYWFTDTLKIPKANKNTAFLIPTYDEMGVGYKDRSAIIDRANEKRIANTIFTNGILINGKVVGTWRRTFEKDVVGVETKAMKRFTSAERAAIEKAAKKYGQFLNKKVKVT